MEFDKILAKSEPVTTLIKHTNDALDCLQKILIWQSKLIDIFCQRYELNKDKVLKNLFLTVAFHDIGKATIDFQHKIRNEAYSQESHSFASIPFIFHYTKDNRCVEFNGENYYPETLAVASHHTKLHKEIYNGFKTVKPKYLIDFLPVFINAINKKAKEFYFLGWTDLIFDYSIIKINPYYILNDEVLDQLTDDEIFYQPNKVRDTFILFKSILHYSDWLASSNYQDYGYSTSQNTKSITHRMHALYPERFVKWSNFQQKAAKVKKNILVQIPTGQGKTEAALLWAVNQVSQQKIIYLLPTMVTTNKMWQRLKSFFGFEQTGLSHSSANYILSKKFPEIESQKLRTHYLYNKTFFKHVTVATIDQLIFSFFNWGYWVMSNSSIYNARIIIDEIHIYDGYTLGLLLKCIEFIKPYNTQFAIMSASLPDVLQEKIEEILPKESFEFIADSSSNEMQRHVVFVEESPIRDQVNNIKNDYHENKNVLIVCNTIKKAREIFDLINGDVIEDEILLYHSQFILKDKIEKEKTLENIKERKGGYIAICTQIVEVSLDIDFDVLYTENAPIDAIIQRLGRVNRKGEIQNRLPNDKFAKVIISKESNISRKYIYEAKILDLTFQYLKNCSKKLNGNIKEKDFKEIINKVYTKNNLPQTFYDDLEEGKTFITKLWHECVKNIYTLSVDEKELFEVSTRKSTYVTVECVLNIHNLKMNFEELLENHHYDKVREYTLKLPIYIAKKYLIKKIGSTDIHLLDISYNELKGISLKQDEQFIL